MTPRPVYSKDRIMTLCDQILRMTSVGTASVTVEHTARSVTQFANGSVRGSEDGDTVRIDFMMSYNHAGQWFSTDESDPAVLRSMVQRCEKIMLDRSGEDQNILEPPDIVKYAQETFVPVQLWHDSTIDAMQASREQLVPSIIDPIRRQNLVPYGFVGFMARARGTMTKNPTEAYYEETDCEVSVTARSSDNTSSGWAGQANRRWEAIDQAAAVAQATDLAHRGMNAKAVEPGRRTVILTREAAAQIMRYFGYFYDNSATDLGKTPFWRQGFPSNRVGTRMFDERITMSSDPSDADGGFEPYFMDAFANQPVTWTDHGILKHLALGASGPAVGMPSAEDPKSLRFSGGTTTIEQMIAQCALGVFVNHFSDVECNQTDEGLRAGLMTGVTRDGCFLVKDGKIDTPIKNYRFIDSPMFMLNNLVALGESKRAAFGYTPWKPPEVDGGEWPRSPIILPPMMIKDFNFTSLADAV